jgi:ABC-type multidrug transport system ATPase subunit
VYTAAHGCSSTDLRSDIELGERAPARVGSDLCRTYGTLRALDGLSFRVERGEIYALLGPNGAGKTSTIEILEGHRRATSGVVRVLGHDPARGGRRLRERVGIVLQSGGLDGELTVAEIVALYASFYARPRDVAGTVDQVGLTTKRQAGSARCPVGSCADWTWRWPWSATRS